MADGMENSAARETASLAPGQELTSARAETFAQDQREAASRCQLKTKN